MIEESELDAIRRDSERLLQDLGRVRIHRFASTTNTGGDQEDSWVPDAYTVAGRVDAMGKAGVGGIVGEQLDERSTHIVTLPARTRLSVKDRVEVENVVWAVTAMRTRTLELVVRAEVMEVV